MKKSLFFLMAKALFINCFSQSTAPGQLKITIESIKCNIKSWDGFVEFDGHGNEVSATYSYRIYNPSNPAAARSGMDETVIFGSNVNGMTRAGTQTPDLGGINNGDVIPVGKQIMNEHINADDYIIIAPTLWEMDGPKTTTFNSFNAQLENDLNWVTNQPFPFATTPVNYENPYGSRVTKIYDKYSYGQATKYHNIFKNFLCPGVGQGNKPVDVRSGIFNNECMVIYPPTLLALDTRVLMAVYNHNRSVSSSTHRERGSIISGFTEIKFIENTYAVATSNGSYSLTLRIEFTPDQQTISPPPPAPIAPAAPKYTKQPVVNTFPNQPPNTIKGNGQQATASANTIKVNIAGNWTGTFGDGESNSPNYYSFRLNADGTMQVVAANGNVIANGNYTYTNNQLTGTYTYNGSGTFSFSAAMESNATLNGTWGSGANVRGGGRWIMSRK